LVKVLVGVAAVTVLTITVLPLATVITGGVTVEVTSVDVWNVRVEAVVTTVVVDVTGVGSVLKTTLLSGARFAIPAGRAARFLWRSAFLYGIERPLKLKWTFAGTGAAERFASAEAVTPARVGVITAFLSRPVGFAGTVQDAVMVFMILMTDALAFVLLTVKVFVVDTVTRDGVMVLVGFLVYCSMLVLFFA
jgi:hypothetical protein